MTAPVRMRRDPDDSAANRQRQPRTQPVADPATDQLKKSIRNRKRRERQPELRVADLEIRSDQRRRGRDTHAVDVIEKVHRAQQRQNNSRRAQPARAHIYHAGFSRGGTRFTLDLSPVHNAARAGVERVAPVHGAAIVPQHQVAHLPLVVPGEFFACSDRPQLVEQRFGLRQRQTLNVGISPASEIKRRGVWFPDACKPADARRRAMSTDRRLAVTPCRT